ncbi:MAG: hypothetical protein ACOH18_01170 [Candidatus Saccharimonadaceae bacterium]
MSEFDFDELDKAVAGATSSDSDVVVSDTSVSDTSVTLPSVTTVSEPVPVQEVVQTPRAVPAARRSSGRFMDVVHPSSDMRTRTSPAVFQAPSPKAEAETSFVPTTTTTIDPPEAVSNSTDEDDDMVFDVSDIENSSVGQWSKQLESPFLTDTKVEKRPLGGVSPESGQILLDEPEEELLLEATALPDPIDFAAHVAALASEKEDTGTLPEVDETEAEEQTIEQLDELKEPEASVPPVLEVSVPELPKVLEEPVGPTSISQQYTEQVAPQQQSGAIFDTESYHQPLTAVPKKRSGVWTVIWILLLVILGAGAGVAFYLYVLPML